MDTIALWYILVSPYTQFPHGPPHLRLTANFLNDNSILWIIVYDLCILSGDGILVLLLVIGLSTLSLK